MVATALISFVHIICSFISSIYASISASNRITHSFILPFFPTYRNVSPYYLFLSPAHISIALGRGSPPHSPSLSIFRPTHTQVFPQLVQSVTVLYVLYNPSSPITHFSNLVLLLRYTTLHYNGRRETHARTLSFLVSSPPSLFF